MERLALLIVLVWGDFVESGFMEQLSGFVLIGEEKGFEFVFFSEFREDIRNVGRRK